MTAVTSDLKKLWQGIELAGGTHAYVQQQMVKQGFVVNRRSTGNMSKRELASYKKELKQEAEQKRQLKKQAWLAYKANHIVHLGEGVYWNDHDDYDAYDLADLDIRAAENELPAAQTPLQLAELMGLTVAQLRWLTYHRDAATKIHYHRFTIPKRDGSERAIWAPMPQLKQAQRWVLDNILSNLWVHDASHGFMTGRSIFSNAIRHTDSRLILKMDIKDFFPSVTLPRVKGLFRKAGYKEQVATLLALLCTEAPREIVQNQGEKFFVSMGPRCLPQGAPTSPGISNALCLRLDRRLMGLAEKYGYRYTRYADDVTFSLPNHSNQEPQLGTLVFLVKQILKEEGFAVHPNKTRVTRNGRRQQVTGLVVNGKALPRVPRTTKRQLRAAIHNLKQGKPLQEGESIDTLKGYAAFIAMSDPKLGHEYLKQLAGFQRD